MGQIAFKAHKGVDVGRHHHTKEQHPPDKTRLRKIGGRMSKSPIYPLPTDQKEFHRLNMEHFILRYMFQRNYRAPVTGHLKRGIRVLHVGCGTGVWSSELAREFPNSAFIGTDISDIFTISAMTAPTNCAFFEANVLTGLQFEDDSFDFVFQRAQTSCFDTESWPAILKELMRVTKPGGYIELLEGCLPIGAGPALTDHCDWFRMLYRLRGIDEHAFSSSALLAAAGLVDIVSSSRQWCFGWGPDEKLAEMSAKNYCEILDAVKPQMASELGIADAEYNQVARDAKEELLNPNTKYRPHLFLYGHYGRKPLED